MLEISRVQCATVGGGSVIVFISKLSEFIQKMHNFDVICVIVIVLYLDHT